MNKKRLDEMALPLELRSKSGVERWAKKYPYQDDDARIQEMLCFAYRRKTNRRTIDHLTRDDLLTVCRWKSRHRND